MRDGTLRKFGILRTFTFAGLMAVTGGCDSNAALAPAPALVAAAEAASPLYDFPEARSRTDVARRRVWMLTYEGVFVQDGAGPLKSLQLPDWQWAGAPYGCLPDLALGPKGEAVVTSDVLSTLWRIDPETLAVSVHPLVLDAEADRDVGFSGLAWSERHGAYFAVSNGQGSLWRIDPMLRRAQKIALSEPVRHACGLATQARGTERKTEKLAGLCVHTAQGSRSIDLAPDQRSAYLRNASCRAL